MSLGVILSSFFAGTLGAMGFGGGSVLIIYLVTFCFLPQQKAQGINLVFFIPIALMSVIISKKQGLIDFKKILPFIVPSLLGAVSGLLLLNIISPDTAAMLFGIMLIIFGTGELFKK